MANIRDLFLAEVSQPDEEINLARAALYISQIEYPNLDLDRYFHSLDEMARQIEIRLPESRYPLKVIQTIGQYLYGDLGFYGNESLGIVIFM